MTETYISRAFECSTGGHAIHEAPGERNHIYLMTRQGEIGPFCPDCAAARLNVSIEELRALQEANR